MDCLTSLYEHCELCPRLCRVDRTVGQLGRCRASDITEIARAALHFWEEPIISGVAGSGTVFFSHCTLGCVYCQNFEVSKLGRGEKITAKRLSEIFLELQREGAHNINLVTPTHYLPAIIQAIGLARNEGLGLPIIYNTSGYERVETLRLLKGFVDIYLTDFKYWNESLGKHYSSVDNYRRASLEALDEMLLQVGSPQYRAFYCTAKSEEASQGRRDKLFDGERGLSASSAEGATKLMTSGVIVRHLLLPGALEDSKQVVRMLSNRYQDAIVLSLMNQYTPMISLEGYSELQERVSLEEYEELLDLADELYPGDYYWQEGDAAEESFIPPFDGTGVLPEG